MLYFDGEQEETGDIHISRRLDGGCVPAENLDPEIDTEHRESDALVAPDARAEHRLAAAQPLKKRTAAART